MNEDFPPGIRTYQRNKYLGLFAAQLHLSPTQVDELTDDDFLNLVDFLNETNGRRDLA